MGMLKNLICKVVRLGFSGPNIISKARNLPVLPLVAKHHLNAELHGVRAPDF
jgi:hypothetical protein